VLESFQKTCIFLTYRCNLRCPGCNIVNQSVEYELSTEEWKRAFINLKSAGCGFVVVFGGEPTLREDLPELIDSLNGLKIPHTIITNGTVVRDRILYERLVRANPWGLTASVNELDIGNSIRGDLVKSSLGARMLYDLRRRGYPGDLVANAVIHAQNIRAIPALIEHFSSMDIWTILTPFNITSRDRSSYFLYRGIKTRLSESMMFKEEHSQIITTVRDWILTNWDKIKLHGSKAWYETWPEFIIRQDWHCRTFNYPAISPDGQFRPCVDRPLDRPLNVLELDSLEKERELVEAVERSTKFCPGCAWDHAALAQAFDNTGRPDLGKVCFKHEALEEGFELKKEHFLVSKE